MPAAARGQFLPFLPSIGGPDGTVIALDMAPEHLQRASMAPLPSACRADVAALPLAAGSLDAIWCANVSQYFSDAGLRACLREFRRALKPGGLLAIKDLDMTGWRIEPAPPFLGLHLAEACAAPGGTDQSVGSIRGRRLGALLDAAGFGEVRQQTRVIERCAPLDDASARFWTEWLTYLAGVARAPVCCRPKIGRSGQRWRRRPARKHSSSQPDFYGSEMQVVAWGRKPEVGCPDDQARRHLHPADQADQPAETDGDLTAYLDWLAERLEVIVVDASPPAVFFENDLRWRNVRHVQPSPALECANGKVWGVLSGLDLASHERIIIGDDDVRYDDASLAAVLDLLDSVRRRAPAELLRAAALARALGQRTLAAQSGERRRLAGHAGGAPLGAAAHRRLRRRLPLREPGAGAHGQGGRRPGSASRSTSSSGGARPTASPLLVAARPPGLRRVRPAGAACFSADLAAVADRLARRSGRRGCSRSTRPSIGARGSRATARRRHAASSPSPHRWPRRCGCSSAQSAAGWPWVRGRSGAALPIGAASSPERRARRRS